MPNKKKVGQETRQARNRTNKKQEEQKPDRRKQDRQENGQA
jgi:hypothetical protein